MRDQRPRVQRMRALDSKAVLRSVPVRGSLTKCCLRFASVLATSEPTRYICIRGAISRRSAPLDGSIEARRSVLIATAVRIATPETG